MLYSLDRPSARVIGRIDDYDDDDYDHDDDTIELELNESAIQALTEAAAVALAAFEERAEPRRTTPAVANELRSTGLEQETPAGDRGPGALEREAPAACQVSEAVEHGAPDARQAGEALEQEAPAARQAAEALEQEAPAVRQAAEALEQEAPAARHSSGAVEQEAPAARHSSGAVEQEAPAARHASEAFEQKAQAPRRAGEALKQETPAGSRGAASVATRGRRKSRQFALGLGMVAAAAGLLGGVAYLATARAPHPIPVVAASGSHPTVAPEAPTSLPVSAAAPASAPAPAPPVAPDVPVRFKNPFDASEVFEFPAGTSPTEMRDAVAELLSQRARERQSAFVKRPRRNTKTPDRDASVTASRVTPRS